MKGKVRPAMMVCDFCKADVNRGEKVKHIEKYHPEIKFTLHDGHPSCALCEKGKCVSFGALLTHYEEAHPEILHPALSKRSLSALGKKRGPYKKHKDALAKTAHKDLIESGTLALIEQEAKAGHDVGKAIANGLLHIISTLKLENTVLVAEKSELMSKVKALSRENGILQQMVKAEENKHTSDILSNAQAALGIHSETPEVEKKG